MNFPINGNGNLIGRIVLLVNTGYIRKKFIIQKLKTLGLKIIVLHKEKNWAEQYADYWIFADTANHTEAMQSVKSFIASNPEVKIEGVLTFWEDDVLLVSKIADRFNLIGIPYAVSKNVRNKFLFRQFCSANGFPSPKHALIKNQDDLKRIGMDFSFPMVIKPAYGSSSAYVVKVEDQDDLERIHQYIKKSISTGIESALSDGVDILVEEYIDGEEVDIDMLLQNGKVKFSCVSDNDKTNEPFFIETGRTTPSVLPEATQEKLKQMAEDLLELLGVQNGVVHFEAKWTPKGPFPLEANLRMGGDEFYQSIRQAWGVDLIENAAKIALGILIRPQMPASPKAYLKSCDFISKHSGVLIELNIDPALEKQKYLEEVYFMKKIGDPVLIPPSGYDYLGWLMVSGQNPIDAKDNLEEAKKFINYTVAKYQPTSSIGKTFRNRSLSMASVISSQIKGQAKIKKIQSLSGVEKLPSLKIGILCNDYAKDPIGAVEADLTLIGHDIEKALIAKGHSVSFYDMNAPLQTINKLASDDIDLVFNLCERINDSSLLEPHGVAMLDILQIPFTGSTALTLAFTMDKIKMKKIFHYHEIPTAKFDYVFDPDEEIDESLKYPLIIKPANTDNSIGISNDSVVTNEKDLRIQLQKVIAETKRPILIEEYIEGFELDIGIIGNGENIKVLPISRTIFDNLPKGYWGIYPFEAKYGEGETVYDKYMVVERPAKISKKQTQIVSEIAIDVYNILDCHDYGRVEMRMDRKGNFYVLELNANPTIGYDSYFRSAAEDSHMNYEDFIETIIKATISRYKDKPPFFHLHNVMTIYPDLPFGRRVGSAK